MKNKLISAKVQDYFNKIYRFKRFNGVIILKLVSVDLEGHKQVLVCNDTGDVVETSLTNITKNKVLNLRLLLTSDEKRINSLLNDCWYHIVQRTSNTTCKSYKNYGARGIKCCQEWLDNKNKFISWAKENGWSEGLQIDRIDNEKGYDPLNCRFVTPAENIRNRRVTQYCIIRGIKMCDAEANKFLNKSESYLASIRRRKSYHLLPNDCEVIVKT